MTYPTLDQLHRKCRHQPKMGGNRETITMPCALVARLIGIARCYKAVNPANVETVLADIESEMNYAEAEAKVFLENRT